MSIRVRLVTVLALAACRTPEGATPDKIKDLDAAVTEHDANRSHDDAVSTHDDAVAIAPDALAISTDAISPDATAISPDATAISPDATAIAPDAGTTTNTVTCYREGDPGATCDLPTTCCFTNYSSAHNGSCGASSCTFGTISCDGPEDCAAGQHCCAHATDDPANGLVSDKLTCQVAACGAPPLDHEICHPGGTCPNGTTCVTAYGNANELPRTLNVCQ